VDVNPGSKVHTPVLRSAGAGRGARARAPSQPPAATRRGAGRASLLGAAHSAPGEPPCALHIEVRNPSARWLQAPDVYEQPPGGVLCVDVWGGGEACRLRILSRAAGGGGVAGHVRRVWMEHCPSPGGRGGCRGRRIAAAANALTRRIGRSTVCPPGIVSVAFSSSSALCPFM
jgi:hypothetical protein